MKWAVILLCLLGVIAAACAAFLVNGMRMPAVEARLAAMKKEDTTEVQVLFATRAIPAMTVVDARLVTGRMMPKNQAPKDFISNTVDVVGKVLAKPIAEGQHFDLSCFAGDTASRLVSEAIPRGKRAVGISVTDYAGLEGMLYPGSTVDVLASFKGQGQDWRDSQTTTLLEKVQVLGIEQQTVVSPGKSLADNASVSRTRRVTLLVDSKQAKALQLAMEHGTLSLALRNPMDDSEANRDSVSVGKLLGGAPPGHVQAPKHELGGFFDLLAKASAAQQAQREREAAAAAAVAKAGPSTQPIAAPPPPPPQWEVTIIRGDSATTAHFPMPVTRPAGEEVREAKKSEIEATPVPMSMSR